MKFDTAEDQIYPFSTTPASSRLVSCSSLVLLRLLRKEEHHDVCLWHHGGRMHHDSTTTIGPSTSPGSNSTAHFNALILSRK